LVPVLVNKNQTEIKSDFETSFGIGTGVELFLRTKLGTRAWFYLCVETGTRPALIGFLKN
jgi:hypothetical protein